MNHSPSEIIAHLLVNAGKAVWSDNLVTATKWKVHILVVPDEIPIKLLTVYDTMGFKAGRIHETGKTVVHPGWQIMVRSLYSSTGYWMTQQIFDFTDTVRNSAVQVLSKSVDGILIPTTNYKVVSLHKSSPIMNAGQDEKRRFLFTLNGTTTIEKL